MKTLYFFFLFIWFLPMNGNSQKTDSSRIKIGISSSADMCSYLVYYNDEYQGSFDLFFNDRPSIGWTAGLACNYSLNPRWAMTGGLRYSVHNIAVGPFTVTDVNGNILGELKVIYHNRFIDLPLGIQYHASPDRKISLLGNACLTPGYAMGEWREMDYEGEPSPYVSDSQQRTEIENFNNFSLKAELYIGAAFHLNKFQVQILPQGRINILKATSDSPVNRRYWTTGMEVRLMYAFGA